MTNDILRDLRDALDQYHKANRMFLKVVGRMLLEERKKSLACPVRLVDNAHRKQKLTNGQ